MSDTYYDKIERKLLIGLYDDILVKINSSDLGYIAEQQDLNRFIIQDEVVQDSVLYFIRINFLTSALKQELFYDDDLRDDDYIYFPILMLVMSKNTVSSTELFKVLSKDVAIPLYFLTRNVNESVKPLAEDDFKTLIDKYCFILQSCYTYGLNNAIILKAGDIKSEEDVFIMDYIFSKLSLAFPESIKFRTNPNKIIIFFKLSYSSKIKNMINEISKSINGNFEVSEMLIDSDINEKILLDIFFNSAF
jgi:hypothetical protein